ncbi:MAG: hypothetical protein SF066_06525 [Thermoanaerobaculia bacterium]|nr:hypothetical protein [Thermoanaerobaculia bacterium]
MADTKHGQPPKDWDADLDIPAITKSFVWTLVITAVSFVAMWFVYSGFKSHLAKQDPPASPVAEAQGRLIPAEPRLQSTAEADLAAVRAQEAARLEAYGLVEGQPGVAHLPIRRAMELYVQKHGGTVPAPATAPAPASEPAPHGAAGH